LPARIDRDETAVAGGGRDRGQVVWAVAMLAGAAGALAQIGGDILWAVPLGGRVARGHLPHSIPYASAPTAGWHDVSAAAQLIVWSLFHAFGGPRGLALAQAAAAAVGFGALAYGLRRETSSRSTFLISVVVLAGSLPAVFVIQLSLFSLALFPLLLALLEAESRSPSRRVWLCVPLLAVWGNLHGEVLVGFALFACYLACWRIRHRVWESVALLAGALVALFVNPALWQTPTYYRSVLDSAVAKRSAGLWRPLGTGTLDLMLVAAAAVLLILALSRGRTAFRLWEAVALAGLAFETIRVARAGPWFLFVAAYPAARALRLGETRPRLLGFIAVVLGCGAAAALIRGPLDPGSYPLARVAAKQGGPVLAEAVLGQQVALAGGQVWIDNPIDAFTQADQSLYLDWLDGKASGAPAVERASYVLVRPGSSAGLLAAHDSRLVRLAGDPSAVLYRIRQ
jgi:hypothetical protein